MLSYVLKTDGTRVEVEPKNAVAFKLEELRAQMGDDFEWLMLKPAKAIMLIQQNSRREELPLNEAATAFAREHGRNKGIEIVGDVMVCAERHMA